jgi:UTP--glucose-1-phosphate uridylyltransferase
MVLTVKKVVIPAAGLGTRLLPITKEMPKEMLPLFFKTKSEKICLKPVLQAVFEQLYGVGFREFCMIVGRGKRVIEDHFTPDLEFVEYLESKNKTKSADELRGFYDKINSSTIIFVNQPEPRGFGDAVLKARSFTGSESFLVHAGDDLILSKGNMHIKTLIRTFEQFGADAVFLVERVKDPRRYGVVEGEKVSERVYKVKTIIEKPKAPRSNLATIAMYLFKPTIYREIEKLMPKKNKEIQLTDAIEGLISQGYEVYAVELKEGKRIDIGVSETYLDALRTTYSL